MTKCKVPDCNNEKALLIPIRLPFCQKHMDLIEPKLKQNLISALCLYDQETTRGTCTEAQKNILENEIYRLFTSAFGQLKGKVA